MPEKFSLNNRFQEKDSLVELALRVRFFYMDTLEKNIFMTVEQLTNMEILSLACVKELSIATLKSKTFKYALKSGYARYTPSMTWFYLPLDALWHLCEIAHTCKVAVLDS